MLLLFGFFRLGFLASFLSHPVIAGFITASGVIIAISQVRHILGIEAHGDNLLQLVTSLAGTVATAHLPTLVTGGATTAVPALGAKWPETGAGAAGHVGLLGRHADPHRAGVCGDRHQRRGLLS